MISQQSMQFLTKRILISPLLGRCIDCPESEGLIKIYELLFKERVRENDDLVIYYYYLYIY